MRLNGKELEGNQIPVQPEGGVNEVEIVLG